MKLAETRFFGRDRQTKFVTKEDKAGLDPKHVHGDEAGRLRVRCQRRPKHIAPVAGTNDLESGFSGVAEAADSAVDSGKRRVGESEIGQELEGVDAAKVA